MRAEPSGRGPGIGEESWPEVGYTASHTPTPGGSLAQKGLGLQAKSPVGGSR